jgi:hypothetical protein
MKISVFWVISPVIIRRSAFDFGEIADPTAILIIPTQFRINPK